MLLAVRTSSYGCTWEVWRALKKLELLSAAPRATLTLLSCSPNFPRASITRCTHAKHEPILNYNIASRAAQSNSVYVRVLQISIVHSRADGVSKSLCQKFFSREQPLLAWGKIFRYSATIMDRNRDSNHQSQNEDNFRPLLLG